MCEEVCPYKAITITNDFELAATKKEDLLVKAGLTIKDSVDVLGQHLKKKNFLCVQAFFTCKRGGCRFL